MVLKNSASQEMLKFQWEFEANNDYVLSSCGKLYNRRTNRFIKKALVTLSEGFWIDRKFYSIATIKRKKVFVPTVKYEVKFPF